MKFLKDSVSLEFKSSGIFKLLNEAIEKKKNGEEVYNGIIGALYNEDGVLTMHKTVFEVFDGVENYNKSAYAPDIDGGEKFANVVKDWVFQDNEFLKKSTVVSTPGGSGTISMCFSELLNDSDTILIPNIFWASYELMGNIRNLKVERYNCFIGQDFSLDDLKEKIINLSKKQKNTLIVINDPAHNPTGYSMSIEHWSDFIEFCNNNSSEENTITILNDIAYIDYSRDLEKSREYMKVFGNINNNILVIFSFSGSKTLTSYGMRIGASIVYHNENEIRNSIHSAFERYARGNWSNCNNGGINMAVDVFSNNREKFIDELKEASKMLNDRIKIFTKKAKEVGLLHYPVKEGFFITLYGIDGQNEILCKKLREKNVYVVPLEKGIRVAICSLNKKECEKLPSIINEVIGEMKDAK